MAIQHDETIGRRYLASSLSSLSASRHQSSQTAKAYRQAAQLFLTRRLPEALSTIAPIITPPPHEQDVDGESEPAPYAPVAAASRGTRVKVWSFYLTLLNAVVELGADEGKHAFGSARWKQLVSQCRDGSVWDIVVRDGYADVPGSVDAEVVVNLATLLLTHAPSQQLNQQKLEAYLAATANPTFDVTTHMLERRPSHRSTHASGTDTPRDLGTRIKLLELYTLHVLPRNEEWDYAREFIAISDVLDDERKEAFLLALHSLKEERDDAQAREERLRQQQHEQMEQRRRDAETRRIEQARAEEERRQREDLLKRQPRPMTPDGQRAKKSHPSHSSRTSRQPTKRPPTPPPNLYARTLAILNNWQKLILNSAHQMTANPLALFRTIMFLLVFTLVIGRRDIRDRIVRMLRRAWDKVRGTVGMGVKVSYI